MHYQYVKALFLVFLGLLGVVAFLTLCEIVINWTIEKIDFFLNR
jgi:hypothetical protein